MKTPAETVLVIRLGALGDIVHTLPAAASLKLSFPQRKLVWVVKEKWRPLFEGNPFIDQLVVIRDNRFGLLSEWRRDLRDLRPELALDFQGLIQSAIIGRLSCPVALWGFDASVARERFAPLLYTRTAHVHGPHRVERNLQLVRAAGGERLTDEAWLPVGQPLGPLPAKPFVLASPFAGWAGKQWPLDHYQQLAHLLAGEGVALVMNTSEQGAAALDSLENVHVHASSLAGLIYATRRAVAVVGVDSGPLHVAAALRKPGVAVFGPTDPAATGPYGGSLAVLRASGFETTYDRHKQIQESMQAIAADQVFAALMRSIEGDRVGALRSL